MREFIHRGMVPFWQRCHKIPDGKQIVFDWLALARFFAKERGEQMGGRFPAIAKVSRKPFVEIRREVYLKLGRTAEADERKIKVTLQN